MRQLSIRLFRRGNKKYPVFYIVVMSKDSRAKGNFFEKIGYFNPNRGENFFFIDSARLGLWLNKGAYLNKSVLKLLAKFLVSHKLT